MGVSSCERLQRSALGWGYLWSSGAMAARYSSAMSGEPAVASSGDLLSCKLRARALQISVDKRAVT